ncbi:MAG TPA: GNAT family N-acetyltransferase [Chthonomonadaceae bacterium]|nr:GNAT family N-acetyltransferase [Chthonomonadaceae bacterium]
MALLETERLILRPMVLEDVDDLAALYADPEVMRFFEGTRSWELARQELEEIIGQYARTEVDFLATIYKQNGQFIGRCGLLWQVFDGVQEVEVAYMIARPYWGQGLATEAARALKEHGFRDFGFRRLISIIDPNNRASIRVAEKNGMHYERRVDFEGYDCSLYTVSKDENHRLQSGLSV